MSNLLSTMNDLVFDLNRIAMVPARRELLPAEFRDVDLEPARGRPERLAAFKRFVLGMLAAMEHSPLMGLFVASN